MDTCCAVLGLGFLCLHAHITGASGFDLGGWRWRAEAGEVSDPKARELLERRAQDLLWDMRRRIFVTMCGRLGMQITFCAVLAYGYMWFRERTSCQAIYFLVALVNYPFLTAIARELFFLSRHRLIVVYVVQYLLLAILCVMPRDWSRVGPDVLAWDGLLVAGRFTMALTLVYKDITIPAQILMSALLIQQRWGTVFLLRELGILATIICCSTTVEIHMRSHIEVVWASADSESMLASFRRLLRGACDGEVLLDSEMKIHGEPASLKHLLMTNISLHGKSFQDILDKDTQLRFAELLEKEDKESSIPPCLRASLRGSNDIKVSVDLFHVPVPQYCGARVYHLIAFREDAELPAQVPEAGLSRSSGGEEFFPRKGLKKPERPRRSESRHFATRRAVPLPELKEITLLVDSASRTLDILQAHFRFSRVQDSEAWMPSLHGLLRPTDRATILAKVLSFAQRFEEGAVEPERLAAWCLKTPGKTYLGAEFVKLSGASSGDKASTLWVQLADFWQT